MTKDEALKLALEKFEFMNHVDSIFEGEFNFQINAIKEALVQPEQKPKCGAIIEVFGKDWRLEYLSLPVGKHKLYTQQYTYTTPPQRTWVGLTHAEIDYQAKKDDHGVYFALGALWAEAKLKEKNT